MTDSPSDFELLHAYATTRNDEAFARVVARHVDFVYAVALRRTRDAHLAEDVTQATFIVLARRASSVKGGSLRAWLHRTVVYASANALRAKSRTGRRERHDAAGALQNLAAVDSSAVAPDAKDLVDEAIERLGSKDRDVIALHYFEGRTIEQTASKLGISHEATRKRVSRALEKLRTILSRRGMTMPVASLGAAVAVDEALVPPAVGVSASAGSNAFSIANGVLRTMRLTMLKQAAVIATALLVVTAVSIAAVDRLATSHPAKRHGNSGAPLKVDLGNGVTFELLGIMDNTAPSNAWAPDGTPLKSPPMPAAKYGARTDRPNEVFSVFANATYPPAAEPGLFKTRVPQMTMWGGAGTPDRGFDWTLSTIPSFTTATIEIGVAAGDWQPVKSYGIKSEKALAQNFEASVIFTPLSTVDGSVFASVSDDALAHQARLVAFDKSGKQYALSVARDGATATSSSTVRTSYGIFKGLTLDALERVEFQVRPFKFVRFEDVSLRNGTITDARVSAGRLEDQPPMERRMYGQQRWNDPLASVFQFIAFSSKLEVDVRWDKLKPAGVNEGTFVRARLQDPTYRECFDTIIAAAGASRVKVIYVENKDLNVKKFVVSTPQDLP